ncbi:probable gluconokinase isoform X2 [Acanthaster planci]|uniref:gluconokinase n=1 Tax=Acanthaster planci TaxID=133434 RepID=A0A8B7ZQJ5_ACAPL|nr:probable gluconokinase isoform X2 [Acanthaster planci]
MAVVLMGVCGSGKSTVGRHLAKTDRHGWLLTLHHILKSWRINHQGGVLACSALKRSYREILCTGQMEAVRQKCSVRHDSSFSPEMPTKKRAFMDSITFVHLKGDREVISSRMSGRDSHFMPVALLDSQFETLEEPAPEEGIRILTEDIGQPVDVIVTHILDFISAQVTCKQL